MRKLFYLGWWFFRARVFGRKAPLQTVLFISDICNLRCKHCSVYELKNPHNMTYDQVRDHLQKSYDAGSRFVDFEGGEVTLWKDGDKRINDLIDLAKEIGFFSCTITTNAQLPFAGSKADSIWVSLDGVNGFRYTFTAKHGGKDYKFMQVFVPRATLMTAELYVFTYTAAADHYDGHLEAVNEIFSHFKWK